MKKRMLLGLLLCMVITGGSEAKAVSITLNDMPTSVDVALCNSTSYVPLRAVTEILEPSAKISWTEGKAVVASPDLYIAARPGDCYLNANGRMLYAADGIQIINGSTYVPVRALSKALGATVTWDSKTKSASLHTGSGAIPSGDIYYNENDLYWLARIISAESKGEPLLGQIAVGNVVLNRVKSPDFPDSIYDVIFDRKWGVQFEPTQNGTIYETPSEESILAAKLCLDGASVVGDCLYFLNPEEAGNPWAMKNRSFVATIGDHYFYTD